MIFIDLVAGVIVPFTNRKGHKSGIIGIDTSHPMAVGLQSWSKWLPTQSFGMHTFSNVCTCIMYRKRNLEPLLNTAMSCHNLVGGFKHVLFSIVYGIILPID